MSEPRAYSLVPPYRRDSAFVKAIDPLRKPPVGYASIQGYDDRIRDVRAGRIAPFWGEEYTFVGRGSPPDLATASAMQYAVSERLRRLLEDAGVEGLVFYPIVVDGTTPMSLMAVTGVAELDWETEGMRMVDGADVGLYAEANLRVSPRIAALIRTAKLDVSLEPSRIPFDVQQGWSAR